MANRTGFLGSPLLEGRLASRVGILLILLPALPLLAVGEVQCARCGAISKRPFVAVTV